MTTTSVLDPSWAQIAAALELAQPHFWFGYVEGINHVAGSHFIQTGGDDLNLSSARVTDYYFLALARNFFPLLHQAALDGTLERHNVRMLRDLAVTASPAPWVVGVPDAQRHTITAADGTTLTCDGTAADMHALVLLRNHLLTLLPPALPLP